MTCASEGVSHSRNCNPLGAIQEGSNDTDSIFNDFVKPLGDRFEARNESNEIVRGTRRVLKLFFRINFVARCLLRQRVHSSRSGTISENFCAVFFK